MTKDSRRELLNKFNAFVFLAWPRICRNVSRTAIPTFVCLFCFMFVFSFYSNTKILFHLRHMETSKILS